MSNSRFEDGVTLLDEDTLNQFETDMKQYADDAVDNMHAGTQTKLGGVKIWVSGSTLYIKTT